MENNYGQKEKNFREVVLKALEKVLEILSKELRLYKKIIVVGGNRSDLVLEEEDTRLSFVQAVQGLALILKPYFDDEMEKIYDGFDELVDMYYFEFRETYREHIDELMGARWKVDGVEKEEDKKLDRGHVDNIHLKMKIRSAKLIFKELNKLLKRQDYLKSAIYGDTESDDEVVEDEGVDE